MYHAGNIHGALAAYDSAIALQPGYVKALNNRGILRAGSMKDYNGAIEDFNRAIEADPRNSDPWLGRGTVWYFLGDMKSACSDWHHASLLGNAKAAQLSRVHCTHQ
jgi:tetratricopeptide (TPR) repeat protein